ncbi:cytochrome P450 [Ktedonobacteria bacterium brp13]|nr:cytochrome P450 [Ktedonobacteria bacterium brp13]
MNKAINKLNLLALRRHYTEPHALYNSLRSQDSLYYDETSQSWLVTGHAAVVKILDDPRFLSSLGSATNSSAGQLSPVSRQMLFMDGEKHKQAQNVMLRPLAHMAKNMPSDIQRFAQEAMATANRTGEMDAVSGFASPISLFTIAHVLGIPADDKAMLQQLENWSDTFGDVTSGYFRGEMQDIKNLEDYFRQLIAQKRRALTDDLLSAFIMAHDIFPEEDDLVANCMMVFAAGRITTKKLLGNGVTLLMQDWETYQKEFQANPRFTKQLGEELLRMITPTRYLIREASEDIDFSDTFPGNHVVRKGQRVLLFLEAADFDPAVFSQPQDFLPHRRPNKHVAFGYGPHQCPGATLARVEIQVALEELLSLSSLQPKPGTCPVWNPNPNLGGFTSNPLVFKPA